MLGHGLCRDFGHILSLGTRRLRQDHQPSPFILETLAYLTLPKTILLQSSSHFSGHSVLES